MHKSHAFRSCQKFSKVYAKRLYNLGINRTYCLEAAWEALMAYVWEMIICVVVKFFVALLSGMIFVINIGRWLGRGFISLVARITKCGR